MNCQNVRLWLSAHLDGQLSDDLEQRVHEHLAECRECALAFDQTLRISSAVRRLPVLAPPAELTHRLRVMASRECARRLLLGSPAAALAELRDRMRLWVDHLMRPLALPMAGGLISALILFSVLVPRMSFRHSLGNDVPLLSLYREAAVATPAPFGFDADHFILEVTVDQNGRMVDYSVADGDRVMHNPRLRRAIENYVLFTGFSPAKAFGQPTYGKVTVSFSRYSFNVGS